MREVGDLLKFEHYDSLAYTYSSTLPQHPLSTFHSPELQEPFLLFPPQRSQLFQPTRTSQHLLNFLPIQPLGALRSV